MRLPDQDPEYVAARDGATAEARDDLKRLVDATRAYLIDTDPEEVVVLITRGLLTQPQWGALELCTVLGVAVVDLAKGQADASS